MIQLLRVDHRLLHGQVVFSWCGQLNPNCILIANDAAATDDVRKAALRLGKPNNAKLVIKTVDDSIAAINEGKTDKYSLMIVTGNVKDNSRSFWRNSGYTRHIGQGQLVSLWGRPHVLLLSCHRGEVGYSWDSTSISSFSRFKASWICRPIVLRVQPLCSPISFCFKCWK